MANVVRLHREAFEGNPTRDKRSPAYIAGAMFGLLLASRLAVWPGRGALPYQEGTAELDAWLAGIEEGRLRWRNRG